MMSSNQIKPGSPEPLAGLSSEWKDPGLMLWLRLGSDPKDPKALSRRPWTAPTNFDLPADKAHEEIKGAGKSTDSFTWTSSLELKHKQGVQRIQRHLDSASDRRKALMEQRAGTAKQTCRYVELKAAALAELEHEIANSGKKGGSHGSHGRRPSTSFAPLPGIGTTTTTSGAGSSSSIMSPNASLTGGGGDSATMSQSLGAGGAAATNTNGMMATTASASSGLVGGSGGGMGKAATTSSLDSTNESLLAYNRTALDPSALQGARLRRLDNLPAHMKSAMWAAHQRSEAAAALKLRREQHERERAEAAKGNPALLLGSYSSSGGAEASSGGGSGLPQAETSSSTSSSSAKKGGEAAGTGTGTTAGSSSRASTSHSESAHIKLHNAMDKLRVVNIFGGGASGGGDGHSNKTKGGSNGDKNKNQVPKSYAVTLPSGEPLPEGVMPWAVETEGLVHRPTKAHARFIARDTRARAINAANSLIATPTLAGGNARKREGLSRDVADYVHALVDVDNNVLYPSQLTREGTENALLFHSVVSEATSCPYSSIGGRSKEELKRLEEQKLRWHKKKSGGRSHRSTSNSGMGDGGSEGCAGGAGGDGGGSSGGGSPGGGRGSGGGRGGGRASRGRGGLGESPDSPPPVQYATNPPSRRAAIFSSKAVAGGLVGGGAVSDLPQYGGGKANDKAEGGVGNGDGGSVGGGGSVQSIETATGKGAGGGRPSTVNFGGGASSLLGSGGSKDSSSAFGLAVAAVAKKKKARQQKQQQQQQQEEPVVFRREAFGRCIPNPTSPLLKRSTTLAGVGLNAAAAGTDRAAKTTAAAASSLSALMGGAAMSGGVAGGVGGSASTGGGGGGSSNGGGGSLLETRSAPARVAQQMMARS